MLDRNELGITEDIVMSDWISVSERLPEEWDRVLARWILQKCDVVADNIVNTLRALLILL